ncbi:signal transduction histidine kinase [Branchiibius hedensis]|uniref:histidine kinase n=1 Tax=Branchiibius hedensis TaxID=672460 RepID=A0A2Y8ZUH4_9MICO|nr:histidine kinase [Branchiibius hedensis]PWJ26863.1 signal transduction histidine kinase [Branchiibius hedensis]SSA35674.1 Signal transduction histidine kinase [Branchiibius hedensis]
MTSTLQVDPWGEDAPLTKRGWAIDIAIGLVPIAITAVNGLHSWPAAILLGVALAIRRRWLAASVALAIIAAIWQVADGNINYVADLGYALIAFRLGAHRDRAVRRFGLIACTVAVVVATVWIAVQGGAPPAVATDLTHRLIAGAILGGLTALVVFGGWVTGYLRYQSRQVVRDRIGLELQSAEERRLRDLVTQQQQRIAIASDMHDVVAHSWAVVAAQADGARYLLRTDPDRAEEALSVIGETARSAMTDIRGLLSRLRDDDSDAPLTLDQPDALIQRLRDAGVSLEVTQEGTPSADPQLTATASRVLTESLTNALKHGDLRTPVRVREDWSDGYRLSVTNSAGARPVGTNGHGLRGMRERVVAAGGMMRAEPADAGTRWQVDVFIPEEKS